LFFNRCLSRDRFAYGIYMYRATNRSDINGFVKNRGRLRVRSKIPVGAIVFRDIVPHFQSTHRGCHGCAALFCIYSRRRKRQREREREREKESARYYARYQNTLASTKYKAEFVISARYRNAGGRQRRFIKRAVSAKGESRRGIRRR